MHIGDWDAFSHNSLYKLSFAITFTVQRFTGFYSSKKSQSKVCPFYPFLIASEKGVSTISIREMRFDFLFAVRHLLLGSLRIQLHISVPFERCLIEIVKQ